MPIPEIRRLNSGDPVVNIRVATSESWRDKNSGDRKEKTEWHNVVIFNDNLAKVAEQYLKKGMKVYVEGQLQTRKWQDQQGADRYTTEIVLQKFRGELQMLDSRGQGEGGQVGYSGGGRSSDFGQSSTRRRLQQGTSSRSRRQHRRRRQRQFLARSRRRHSVLSCAKGRFDKAGGAIELGACPDLHAITFSPYAGRRKRCAPSLV